MRFFNRNILPFLALFFAIGCASIQRPMGGPRDRTPPKLLKALPQNQTRNFSAKQIVLTFDEYFKLNSQYQEISISPAMEKAPEYIIRQKNLVIKIKDTLAKNTTYVINFGKGIADVNEGNILKNFTYVFSTGPQIDSLQVSGKVSNVQTQLPEKDVTVMLFPLAKDTAYYGKKKPAIYTTTDSAGTFKLSNLKGGDYTIYALKEATANRIYDNEDELIAFSKQIIHLKKDTANIALKLFKQIPAKLRLKERRIDSDGKLLFYFNKGIENANVKIWDKELDAQKQVSFSKAADSAYIYLPNMTFDSVKVSFLSGTKPLDTLTLRRSKKDTYKRKLEIRTAAAGDYLKPGTTTYSLSTNYPIATFDESRLVVTEDSIQIDDYKLLRDPKDLTKFSLQYPWHTGRTYEVAINEGTIHDIYGDKNEKVSKTFKLDKPENYSQLTLKIHLSDTGKNHIVQLLNEAGQVLYTESVTKNKNLVYKNQAISKYNVRVIYDTNKNGKWDTGNVKLKQQPENIFVYKKEITLRSNFDIEQDIDVPKELELNP